MNKPNAFDEVKASQSKETVELGGHYAKIMKVIETKSKNNKDMIVVAYDFAFPDKQENFFMNEYQKDEKEDKKWPFQGKKYIMVNDYADSAKVSKAFTSFCSAVEKSNDGFEIAWGSDWDQQFVGKKVGVVYGLEENEYNGINFMRPTPKWFCPIDKVDSAAVPDPKYLKAKEEPQAGTFTKIEEEIEIPF